MMYQNTLNQYSKSYTTAPCIYFWQPSSTPSWIFQLAPTMANCSWQIHKLQGVTNILVYNI